MKSQILGSTLSQLRVEQHFEHLYLSWQQASGNRCRFSLPLPLNGWQRIMLLVDTAAHALMLEQAVKGELVVIDCNELWHLCHLGATPCSSLMSLQTNADVFCANVNFRKRPHDLGDTPDISIRGPERLFASFNHAAISGLGQCASPVISCAKPRRTPSLVLQTDCPSVHIDGAQLLHVGHVGGSRIYTLCSGQLILAT